MWHLFFKTYELYNVECHGYCHILRLKNVAEMCFCFVFYNVKY